MMIIFAGLPGTGKTTIARTLAQQINAVFLRVDSIEQALRDSGATDQEIGDAGYRVGYAIAEDNLRLGFTVVADSVNPIALSRDAWVAVAERAHVNYVQVEIMCSDKNLHRRRLETRSSDIHGLKLPTWQDVIDREYQPWDGKHIVIDTAGKSATDSVRELRRKLVSVGSGI
jgi:predicted kinase